MRDEKNMKEGFSMDFTNLPLGSEYTILQMKWSNEQKKKKSVCVYVVKITEEKWRNSSELSA